MDRIRETLGDRSLTTTVAAAAAVAVSAVGLKLAAAFVSGRRLQAARAEWNAEDKKDVVILHQFPRGLTCINLSPFPMKVEAWLRVNGVKYEVDDRFPMNPETGKSPWVTLNGEEIADSQMVVEKLARHFGKDIK